MGSVVMGLTTYKKERVSEGKRSLAYEDNAYFIDLQSVNGLLLVLRWPFVFVGGAMVA